MSKVKKIGTLSEKEMKERGIISPNKKSDNRAKIIDKIDPIELRSRLNQNRGLRGIISRKAEDTKTQRILNRVREI